MTVPSSLVLAAHGTRDPAGIAELDLLASLVALRLPGVAVRVGYVDVLGPSVASVLSAVDGPVTLVPLFLAAGYHVRSDIPAAVAHSNRHDITVTPALGPDPALVDVALARLRAAGAYLPGAPGAHATGGLDANSAGAGGHFADAGRSADAVVLAAAGSADPRAIADVQSAAKMFGAPAGFIATASPSITAVVRAQRARQSGGRVAIASWLLAPGFFHAQLANAGADIVAGPLGAHPVVVDLIVRRVTAPSVRRLGSPSSGYEARAPQARSAMAVPVT